MTETPPKEAESTDEARSPARAIWGGVALLALLLLGFAALRFTPLGNVLDREWLISSLDHLREAWWAPAAFLGLYLVLCPLGMPTSPLMATGAVVFGAFWGSVYNLAGSVLGAAVSYFLARGLGRELVLHFFGKRLARFDKVLQRHGFWTLVRMRFLPIPFPVLSYGPALVGIRPLPYLTATVLGLLVPVPVWTYFWSSLFGAAAGEIASASRNLILALVLFLVISFLPRLVVGLRRRKRYRELQAQRQASGRSPQSQ